ncbi:S8 family serine peptidase, partial [Methylobrevis pamukkalensis]|uniref:S8 family serine peptidase n=1 Tax=Methylobrevis pamukkalensis TaxID=1439726 RepID=UPI000B17641A
AERGYTVVERADSPLAGGTYVRMRLPAGVSLEAARAAVTVFAPTATVDRNHYYRPGWATCDGPECAAPRSVAFPARAMSACAADIRIGIVDTGVNASHEALEGARLEVIPLRGADDTPSSRKHGTAVAALLVGDPASRTPGLIPAADLIAVDPFTKAGGEDRMEVFDFVRALDLLASREVEIINLSLSGPGNAVLAQAIAALAARDVVLVAAAGNGGPAAPPAYPAAYPEVVTVTAVDRGLRPYRRAARGEHVDLAAPGVEVWAAASISGARPQTGTSFAAPFVTAAAALLRSAEPDLDAAAV